MSIHSGQVGDKHLTRWPRRKSVRGEAKFHASVQLTVDTGRALREVARMQERSVSDIVGDACVYWLDINYPLWREHGIGHPDTQEQP